MSKTIIDLVLYELEGGRDPKDAQVKQAIEEYRQILHRKPETCTKLKVIDYLFREYADVKLTAARAEGLIPTAKLEYEQLKQLLNTYSPNQSHQQSPQNRTPGTRYDDLYSGQERSTYEQIDTSGHVTQPDLKPELRKSREDKPVAHRADTRHYGHPYQEQQENSKEKGTSGYVTQPGLEKEPESWKFPKEKSPQQRADTGHEGKNISYALRRNNPEIADLSDDNRPTKIAERYSELYDNEWTDAYDAITSASKVKDRRAIEFLYEVVKDAYKFCCNRAEKQIKEMRKEFLNIIGSTSSSPQAPKEGSKVAENEDDDWILLQYRKGIAEVAVSGIVEEFRRDKFKGIFSKCFQDVKLQHTPSQGGPLDKFVSRAAQLSWWMAVQDPPVYMDIPDPGAKGGAKFDSSLYRAYTQSGNLVEYYVWPALRLCKERDNKPGPILVKGVAQGKN